MSNETSTESGALKIPSTPRRLRNLMYRLTTLTPGQAYNVTVIVLDEEHDPVFVVTPLGKIENISRQNVDMG